MTVNTITACWQPGSRNALELQGPGPPELGVSAHHRVDERGLHHGEFSHSHKIYDPMHNPPSLLGLQKLQLHHPARSDADPLLNHITWWKFLTL